jgi:hypothetical protein
VLSIYHHYLVVVNNTTNENLKKTFKQTGNPFRMRCCTNLAYIFSLKNKMLWNPRAYPATLQRSKAYEVEEAEADIKEESPVKVEEVELLIKPGEIHNE